MLLFMFILLFFEKKYLYIYFLIIFIGMGYINIQRIFESLDFNVPNKKDFYKF